MSDTILGKEELRTRVAAIQARLAAILRDATASRSWPSQDAAIAQALPDLEQEFAQLMRQLRAHLDARE